ncbi:MAG TPA: hypothetical protein PLE88_12005 [Anaerohalosphaeraceae bacterium]|nr:hypothetical protein [Anaerohalosphaeraceae bacterium]
MNCERSIKRDLIKKIQLLRIDRPLVSTRAGETMNMDEVIESTNGYQKKPLAELQWLLLNERAVREINKMFPPVHPHHPAAFIRLDETQAMISGESMVYEHINGETFETTLNDYYENYIHPKLTEWAEKNHCHFEWENPAGICLAL